MQNPLLFPRRMMITAVHFALLATAGSLTIATPVAHAQTLEAQYNLDIAAGPLSTALTQIALQTGANLTANAALTNGKKIAALKGNMTLSHALEKILSGTGLQAVQLGNGYVLRATPAASPVVKEETDVLPEVNVTALGYKENAYGPVNGYVAKRTATATKTDTPIIETPQSISVITADQITDQKVMSIQEALRYSTGVAADQYGMDSRSDGYAIRGMEAVQYLDGLRQINTYYSETIRPDPFMMERVEVLRGPASTLYGQGGVGGIVNLVSKRPLTEARREIGVSLGNYDFKQIQADFTGPVADSDTLFYRLVMVGKDTDTQVDHAYQKRTLFAPSLTWKPSDKTSLTLIARYQLDDSLPTPQFLPVYGVLKPNPNGRIPYDNYLGEPGFDKYISESTHLGWIFDHQLNDTWSVRQNFRWTKSRNNYSSLYVNSFTFDPSVNPFPTAGQNVLPRYYDVSKTHSFTLNVDTNAKAHFDLGSTLHTVLIGLDYARFRKTGVAGYDDGTGNLIDIYNPVYGNIDSVATLSALPETRVMQTGLYLQDQIKFDQHWVLTAGIRRDKAENRSEGSVPQESYKTTQRYGLNYLFDNGWSPYVSYAESFLPLTNLSVNGGYLKPQEGKQWEAGLKYMPANSPTRFTIAAYHLADENRPIYVMSNLYTQKGRIVSRGIEMEGATSFGDRWDVLASWSYTDAKYDVTDNPAEKGQQVETIPKYLASGWLTKRFSIGDVSGFRAGFGVRYIGESWNSTHIVKTPDVTLFDAMIGLDYGNWRYALNASNLADKEYVSTCITRGDCWIGARRAAIASATYSW
ncbi:TonB-dependent siderophore receptor [Methylophilus sp. OH31]|uniref:TonB-dependent siderophore receptor n=1 Tax=Methylophilus sp. OH31 TaxID=1387312 RepID=UPI0004B28DAC|nr:TonB-dependent siderophore receptor [Methylophilus sp. OH31]